MFKIASAIKQVACSNILPIKPSTNTIFSYFYSTTSFPMGKIYDKVPVKVTLEKDKQYSWCTCGCSKKQPFCDGSHKELNASNPDTSTHFRSHKFVADETKEYFLCNCKQTKNRPFCDGTHKEKFVQEADLSAA